VGVGAGEVGPGISSPGGGGGGGGGVTSFNSRTGAVTPQSGDYTVAEITGAAPLASPTFTGTPAAPTATSGTNTTQVATTAFVQTAAGLLIPKSLVTTAGDLIAGTGAGTVERLPMGTAGQVLTVGGADPSGLEWAPGPSGTYAPIATPDIQVGNADFLYLHQFFR
jgi:hypothetical protein